MCKTYLATVIFCFLLLALSGCQKMENTIEIEFDPTENDLVVECYLEAGKPYRLMLTETKGYFEVSNICPFVRNALIVITHDGLKDTLVEAFFSGNGCSSIVPFWNSDSTRFFNYGSNSLCPSDFDHEFTLEVWDTLNDRYITAVTKLLPPVPTSIFRTEFNADTIAFCILGCQDNPNTTDYYRMTMHKFSLSKIENGGFFKYVARNPYVDQIMHDQGAFSGQNIVYSSGYDFYRTDSIISTIYHIDQAYYDYLQTSRDAENANLNPFAQPTTVMSNIQGGYGIFTFLSYDRDTLYIPW